MTRPLAVLVSLVGLVSVARSAHAESPLDRHARAHFSGKRLALETVAGELVGALVTTVAFDAMCSTGSDCFGAGIGAFAVNVAVTPLAVWGTGRALDGEGSLGYSYVGASLAMTPFSVTGSPDESPADGLSRIEIEVAISSILLAPCSALAFEASSQGAWAREHAVGLAVRPIRDGGAAGGGVNGAIGMISARW